MNTFGLPSMLLHFYYDFTYHILHPESNQPLPSSRRSHVGNIICRQSVWFISSTDRHFGFLKVSFQTFAIKGLFPFSVLFESPLRVLLMKTKSSVCNISLSTSIGRSTSFCCSTSTITASYTSFYSTPLLSILVLLLV